MSITLLELNEAYRIDREIVQKNNWHNKEEYFSQGIASCGDDDIPEKTNYT